MTSPTPTHSTGSLSPRYGVVRLYDRCCRLLAVDYVSERLPVTGLDHQLLLDAGAVATFTPTRDHASALDLMAELSPLFPRPRRSYLAQPGGLEFSTLSDRARDGGVTAHGAYVEPCPACRAGAHDRCHADRKQLAEPHAARGDAAAAAEAERHAVFDADPGFIVWTSPSRGLVGRPGL